MNRIMIYGANGFVGKAAAQLAKEKGLNPILAGRNHEEISKIAEELNLECKIFSLENDTIIDKHLENTEVLLNCAGPFFETYKPLVNSCIKTKTHYLDISGEIPVFQAIHRLDEEAKKQKVMLLPGIGFDVTPTDCLALYLKENFEEGNKLTLAFHSDGPAGIPPGTMKTAVSLIPFGNWTRKNGKLQKAGKGMKAHFFKLNDKEVKALSISWGDIYTAYHSTGIPNIEVYSSFPQATMIQLKFIDLFRPVLSLPFVLNFLKRTLKGGSTAEERAKTRMYVYAELEDAKGNKASCRMKGPEGGLVWTSMTAIHALIKIKNATWKSGYQTPSSAFGSDFVMECEGVERSEIEYN